MGILASLVDQSAPQEEMGLDDAMPPPSSGHQPPQSVVDAAAQVSVSDTQLRTEAAETVAAEAPLPASEQAALQATIAMQEVEPEERSPEAKPPVETSIKAESLGASAAPLVGKVVALLQEHQWSDLGSENQEVRARGLARAFFLRRLVLSACAAGQEAPLRDAWARNAPSDAPAFDEVIERRRAHFDMFPMAVGGPSVSQAFTASKDLATRPPVEHEPAAMPAFPVRPQVVATPSVAPANSNSSPPAPPPQVIGGGGGFGLGIGELVKAPFALASTAGSLVLAGLTRAGHAAHGAYVRQRANGHAVLGGQVNASAARVVELAGRLKNQGMSDVVDAMRRTGAPMSEVLEGMGEGGKYDALGKKYDKLLKQPDVAQTLADIQQEMGRFSHLSERYAKTGAALSLDVDTPVKHGGEAMMEALDGIPMKEGGKFGELQEKLQEVIRRLIETIERLFSRLTPAGA